MDLTELKDLQCKMQMKECPSHTEARIKIPSALDKQVITLFKGESTNFEETTVTVGNKAMRDDAATEEVGLREYFLSKVEVEEAVRNGNFKTYTLIRPAVLHTDFMLPYVHNNFPGLPTGGELGHGFNDGVRMFYTDLYDVGKYAAAALGDPARFASQEIDLMNELLTIEEVRDILVKVSGRDVRVRRWTAAEVKGVKNTVHGMLFHL